MIRLPQFTQANLDRFNQMIGARTGRTYTMDQFRRAMQMTASAAPFGMFSRATGLPNISRAFGGGASRAPVTPRTVGMSRPATGMFSRASGLPNILQPLWMRR